ncbi:MAG: DoxX family protein [Cyclobacteriaceae bacterium]|nr:DoxX family protein [Cyclobacteriaceae bacterium]
MKSLFSTQIRTGRVNVALLLFRVAMGGIMLTHGWPKFQRLVQGDWGFGDPLGIGSELSFILVTIAEFFGSLMVILGLATRVGAFLVSFAMLVAGFIQHAGEPFGSKEKAFLLLTGFLFVFITGAGKFSFDDRIH